MSPHHCLFFNTPIPEPIYGDSIEDYCSLLCMHDDLDKKGLLKPKPVNPNEDEEDFLALLNA